MKTIKRLHKKALEAKKKRTYAIELRGLSPEGITARALAVTNVLKSILARGLANVDLRHSGARY